MALVGSEWYVYCQGGWMVSFNKMLMPIVIYNKKIIFYYNKYYFKL